MMHLVLSEARKTRSFQRGGEPFLQPDFHAPIDEFDVIRLEGVLRFYQADRGFYVTFDTEENAWAAHEKTGWLQDETQPHVTLYTSFDWGAGGAIYINQKAYMNFRVEQP